MKNGIDVSADAFIAMSSAQQQAILSSSLLKAEQKGILSSALAAAAGENVQTAATSGLSAAFAGLGASLKVLALNPLTWVIGATAGLLMLANYMSKAGERAKETAQESANAYQATLSETESLNSELQTTQDRITELQAQDSLTPTEESELANLQAQNEESQRQIELKQQLLDIQGQKAAEDARDSIDYQGEQATYHQYDENGNITSSETKAVDRKEYIRQQIELMENAQKDIEAWESKLLDKSLSDNERKRYQAQIDTAKENYDRWKSEITTMSSELSEEAQSFYTSDGSIRSGFEEDAKAIGEIVNMVSSIDLSPAEKKLKNIESYFDGSTSKNALKNKLLDVAKAEGKLGSVSDALKAMGIDLESAGLDADTLNRYFQELVDSANEAAEATSKVNNNLTMSDVEKAFESANSGDNYVSLNDYLTKAKELYDQGLVGTDDFKSVAEMISYNVDSSAESFKANYDKLQRYFTEDSDGNLTGQGIHNFLADLQALGKGYAEFTDGKWNLEMENTAQAAKDMGMSVQSFEAMLGRIQDYDNLGEFEFVSAIQEFEEAKSSLEGLQTIFDKLEDGDYKDSLKLKLDEWSPMIEAAEDDLASLPTEVVTQLKFEYDLATIQQQLDELDSKWDNGDRSQETGAALIATQESYREKREEQTGYTEESDKVYAKSYEALSTLSEKFNQDGLSSDDIADIQAQKKGITELQSAFQDALAAGETTDWSSFLQTDEAIRDMNSLVQSTDMTRNELEEMLGVDLPAMDFNVNDTELRELFEKVNALKAGESFTLEAEVDGEGLQEIEAIKNEDGTMTYTVEIDGETKELSMLPTEDGSIEFAIKVEDEATPVIDEVTQREVEDKIVTLVAEDEATYVIDIWNTLSADPKFATLSAEDQATAVINFWNSLTPEDKQAYMNGEITLTDNTAVAAASAEGNIESVPKETDAVISATDNTTGAVSSATLALDTIDGKTAHTYIITHKSTVGGDKLAGTAHLSGTAHATGTIGDDSWLKPEWETKKDEVALMGEEAPEIVATRDGYWYTVGEKGAEFAHVPAGSVVFDGKQSKELLTKGHINGRGKAHLGGTAYLGSSTGGFSFGGGASQYNTGYATSTSSNTAAVNSNTSATEDNTDSQENLRDWIERLTDIQGEQNDRLKELAESYEMHANQNRAIDNYVTDSKEYAETLRKSQNYYMTKANGLGLSSSYVKKIVNGEISIEDITDEALAEKISQFEEWYDAARDLGNQIDEINQNIREMKIQKLENIKDDYDNLVDYANSIIDYNEAINDLYEERNLVGNEDPLQQVIDQQANIRQALVNEYKELNDQLTELVADGTIGEYTDTWLEWKTEINGVQQAFVECDSSLEELKETMREIRLKDFENSLDNLDFSSDMASSIRDLMSEEGIFDEKGLTKSGIAQLGLLGTELVSAKQKVANYNVAIEALNKDLENGNITQAQFNEQLKEYQEGQLDAVKATKSARSAILDLIKTGIEKENEAMQESISKRKELLDLQREYYDFQKEMSDQSKQINSLRSQLAALEGDDSIEALRKRQNIQSQLMELEDEYQQSLKDREYDLVSDAYDELSDSLDENMDDTLHELETNLDSQNKAIENALNIAKENYGDVYDQLQELAKEYGFVLKEAITTPWTDAEAAINQYLQAVGKLDGSISIDTSPITSGETSKEQTVPTDKEPSVTNKSETGTWLKQGNGWWYQHSDGSYTTNGWEQIDGKMYKFDQNGWMQTGWQKDGTDESGNANWYYMNSSGAMQTGWQKVGGKWYYMNSEGLMQRGLQNIDGSTYLLSDQGDMKIGWQYMDDSWYYFNRSGDMAKSKWIDDKYYVDETGKMATYGYVKSKKSDVYYWVNKDGVYEPRWTTTTPDLNKYKLYYNSGAKKIPYDTYAFTDDTKEHKLDLGSEVVITDKGAFQQLPGGSTVFNEKQVDRLWEFSNGLSWNIPDLPTVPDFSRIAERNVDNSISVHYDNLVGNIEYIDKKALPELEVILKKSFEYNVKKLKEYSKR